MDVLFEMLKDLATSMNLGTFLLVLAIIALSSFIIVGYLVKNSGKRTGFWAFFRPDKDKRDNELADVKSELKDLKETLSEMFTCQEMINQAVKELNTARLDEKDTLLKELEKGQVDREEIAKELDDIKQWFKIRVVNNDSTNEKFRDLLENTLDLLTKMNLQAVKIDDYVRDVLVELKSDHKEINKGIAELSKDMALIERTIQTQGSSSGIKLR